MTPPPTGGTTYGWSDAAAPHSCAYLVGPVVRLCRELGARRVLDVGCGNGALAAALAAGGFDVTGCDDDAAGVEIARRVAPAARFESVGVYDDPARLGVADFDVAVATEVIEHLFRPAALPQFATAVLKPRGHLILTTPYHGYLKNLALSLANGWDRHFSPLWDGGHIKFWSPATLTQLLNREGYDVVRITGSGRVRWFWKSMIVVARKRT
ncbi:MAG TPA: class I SAM-dependent methyltransferase [Gemmataceae bacterium]|jgi:2-polyprenyl-6-hydroxyphenyl methylase/3-demethylubiquinone-9 3-methyltransferase